MRLSINIEEYKKNVLLSEKIKKLEKTISEMEEQIYNLEVGIRSDEGNLNNYKNKQKELNTFKNRLFNSKLRKNEINELIYRIKYLEETITQNIIKRNIIRIKKESLESKLENLKIDLSYTISNNIKADDGAIIVTDEINENYNEKLNDVDILVHVTDFFPKNKKILSNYDGEKMGEVSVEYDSVKKTCNLLSHRHTCHFTINNVVKSTGEGSGKWEQPKYIIIDELDQYKEQFVNLLPSDSWTFGSLQLKGKPLLLVREDCYNDIPEEERDNWQIIKYKGNYTKCVRNIMNILGYKLKETDVNYAGHAWSIEGEMESILDYRNLYYNYIVDNKYSGKGNTNLTNQQLFYLYQVMDKNRVFSNKYIARLIYEINKKYPDISEDFIAFVVQYGITIKENKIQFIKDEDFYEYYKNCHKMNENEDFDKLDDLLHKVKDIHEIYKEAERNQHLQKEKFIDEQTLNSYNIKDLCKFENINIAKRVIKIIENKTNISSENIIFSNEGITLYMIDFDTFAETYYKITSDKLDEIIKEINSYTNTLQNNNEKKYA